MVSHLDSCLGCMACLAACPSGVRYDVVIEEARARIEASGVRTRADAGRRSAIFSLFPHPGRLRVAAVFLWLWRVTGPALAHPGHRASPGSSPSSAGSTRWPPTSGSAR